MKISVKKITDKALCDLACSYTAGKDILVNSMYKMYVSEHSPSRTQLFTVAMDNIPTFVSVHLVRHKVGVEHFVKSNREDRGGDTTAGRLTPVNHLMLCNAQALINMARKRLCGKASVETQQVFQEIWYAVHEVDPELAKCMVPDCMYRGRCCEFVSCGLVLTKRRG